jgi:hypothetical protein
VSEGEGVGVGVGVGVRVGINHKKTHTHTHNRFSPLGEGVGEENSIISHSQPYLHSASLNVTTFIPTQPSPSIFLL